uniref:Uncharacterized protein n=1 Tax=Oryza barthii TaxID=65489 RepID=A0A0D3F351_9ORYZ
MPIPPPSMPTPVAVRRTAASLPPSDVSLFGERDITRCLLHRCCAVPLPQASPPWIGNGCKHRQIRFTEKFFLSDIVVHKVGSATIPCNQKYEVGTVQFKNRFFSTKIIRQGLSPRVEKSGIARGIARENF